MEQSAALLQANRSNGALNKSAFSVVDGRRLPCANYVNTEKQNDFYEGYTQSLELINLQVYSFQREVTRAAMNFPESWHDNKLATLTGLLYPKLAREMAPPGMAILCNSAYMFDGRVIGDKTVRTRKINETIGV